MIYYLYSSSTSRYVCAVSVQILLTSAQAFSGLSHQSHQLNATTLSDADSDQSPDAQQENCFSLGSCVQPSSPSALIWCFLSRVFWSQPAAELINTNVARGHIGSQPCPLTSSSHHNLTDSIEKLMFAVLSAVTFPLLCFTKIPLTHRSWWAA